MKFDGSLPLFPDLDEIFAAAHREIRPRTPLPEITIEFFPFAGLNHTARLHEKQLRVRVSDIFTDAPPHVYHSLALILLSKLYGKKVDKSHHHTYRTFILRADVQERTKATRDVRCRETRVRGSRGQHIDLDEMFERLNGHYFGGSIPKPRLSWSARRSRYVLGRFDATHNTIFISRVFDSPRVPRYVCEYVMYHEMLHVKHRSQIHQTRIVVHTRDFRLEEKRFEHYRDAKLWLKQQL